MAYEKGNQPSAATRPFGLWATEPAQREFRLAAVKNLQDALQAYSGHPPLTEEEVKFCEGWLYLARQEIGTVSDGDLDQKLVEMAEKHLNDPEAEVLNG